MLWLLMTVIAILGGFLMLRRKRSYESVEQEPWRASLAQEDEPLDLEEIRKAEEEWLNSTDWEDSPEDEPWR
jgi:hypothetical protein